MIKRKTDPSRFTRSLQRTQRWCRRWRHAKLAWQQQQLSQRLRGHYAYYGIINNYRSLGQLSPAGHAHLAKWLDRRSQTAAMPWDRSNRLLAVYPLPRPRIVHAV